MATFAGGEMKTVMGKGTGVYVLEMDSGKPFSFDKSNTFCKGLLKTYFAGKLTTTKINNIVRKHKGHIEVSKDKYKTSYIYQFETPELVQKVADEINAIVVSLKLGNN